MSLFPQRLARIHHVVEFELVPVENGAFARYVMDDQGRRWVRKREEDTGFQPLLAEAISTLLGRHIGAPVPDGAVYVGTGGQAWLSALVENAGHWSSTRRDNIVNLSEVGALITLDALVLNDDRHARNILVVPDPDEAHLRVVGIDCGNALVGLPSDFVEWPPDGPPRVGNQARGLPLDAVVEGAVAAATVAAGLDPALIREFVVEGCGIVREPAVDALTTALKARCRRAAELAVRYLEALGTLK